MAIQSCSPPQLATSISHVKSKTITLPHLQDMLREQECATSILLRRNVTASASSSPTHGMLSASRSSTTSCDSQPHYHPRTPHEHLMNARQALTSTFLSSSFRSTSLQPMSIAPSFGAKDADIVRHLLNRARRSRQPISRRDQASDKTSLSSPEYDTASTSYPQSVQAKHAAHSLFHFRPGKALFPQAEAAHLEDGLYSFFANYSTVDKVAIAKQEYASLIPWLTNPTDSRQQILDIARSPSDLSICPCYHYKDCSSPSFAR